MKARPGQPGRERNYLLTLAYDGSGFSGWQRLGGGARTVQKTLEDALSSMLGERINVIGAGRTDAGVHAEGQAANFRTVSGLGADELRSALDGALPPDLCCVSVREAVPEFHARYRAVSKTYAYRFHDGPIRDPFEARWSLHVGRRLDVSAMREACAALVGERDYSALSNAKEDARGFVRNLFEARVERRGDLVEVGFRADGFLYNQARVMAACAMEAGLGRMPPGRLAELVASKDRSRAPGALGAYGLRLLRVEYRADDFSGPGSGRPEPRRPDRDEGPPPGQARVRSDGLSSGRPSGEPGRGDRRPRGGDGRSPRSPEPR
ncbi:MAG TPA: tRNA pseudouridine(38-40) synthase TruA [Spirochaetales bacterium]|nr:tRNA pseudouridine(38-40) synthase TruA [Spirochaetales bacterium]